MQFWRLVLLATLPILWIVGCRSARPQPALPIAEASDASVLPADEPAREAETKDDFSLAQYEHVEAIPSGPPENFVEPAPLSLGDFKALALQNNPALAAAAVRIDAARGKTFQAGRYPNPVAGYHARQMGQLGTAGQQGAFVSQRIITAGKLGLEQAMAGKKQEEALFQFETEKQRLLTEVRTRFYEALLAQRRVTLTEQLAAIGDELVAATQKLLESRLGTENDLLQAQIKADESQILLDNAINQWQETWRRLATVVGEPAMPVSGLSGQLDSDLPNLEWKSSLAMVLSGNPELAAAAARVDRADLAVIRARKDPIPNVDVSIAVRHDNITSDDVVNVQAGIPIPIFDKNRGNILAAEAERQAASQAVRQLELDLHDRLAVAFRRFENARHQVERYGQSIVPRAEQSLQLVAEGYEQGQVEYLTLLTAQQTHLQAKLSYLDALRALWTSVAAIEGQLSAESLDGQK